MKYKWVQLTLATVLILHTLQTNANKRNGFKRWKPNGKFGYNTRYVPQDYNDVEVDYDSYGYPVVDSYKKSKDAFDFIRIPDVENDQHFLRDSSKVNAANKIPNTNVFNSATSQGVGSSVGLGKNIERKGRKLRDSDTSEDDDYKADFSFGGSTEDTTHRSNHKGKKPSKERRKTTTVARTKSKTRKPKKTKPRHKKTKKPRHKRTKRPHHHHHHHEIILPPHQPVLLPPNQPTLLPPNQPTLLPPNQPTLLPPNQPTLLPPNQPTLLPPNQPTLLPPNQPTLLPPNQPTLLPPNQPTFLPPNQPTFLPPNQPTLLPPNQPTLLPPNEQTLLPSHQPTSTPSRHHRTTHRPSATSSNEENDSAYLTIPPGPVGDGYIDKPIIIHIHVHDRRKRKQNQRPKRG